MAWAKIYILAIATAFARRCNGRRTVTAAFSRAAPCEGFTTRPHETRVYGYEAVKSKAQSRSLSSLLRRLKRAIAAAKNQRWRRPATARDISPGRSTARASPMSGSYRRTRSYPLRAKPVAIGASTELDSFAWKDRSHGKCSGRTRFRRSAKCPMMIHVAPYGFYWFQIAGARQVAEQPLHPSYPEFENHRWCRSARPGFLWPAPGVIRTDVLPGHWPRTAVPLSARRRPIHRLTSAIPLCDIGDQPAWLPFRDDPARHKAGRIAEKDRVGAFDRES